MDLDEFYLIFSSIDHKFVINTAGLNGINKIENDFSVAN